MDTLLSAIEADPVFQQTASAYLVLDRELVIRAVNPAYEEATGRTQDQLVGRFVFDAFPDNPAVPDADGVRNLNDSLGSVLRHGRQHRMRVQRYDVRCPTDDDSFVLGYWTPVNSPLPDERGQTVGILHHVHDVTAVWTRALRLHQTSLDEGQTSADHDGDDLWRYALAFSHEDLVRDEATTEVAQLRVALDSRVLIEQAKGVVMAQRGCDPDAAFALLRRRARDTRTNLHDICAAVVANATRVASEGSPTE